MFSRIPNLRFFFFGEKNGPMVDVCNIRYKEWKLGQIFVAFSEFLNFLNIFFSLKALTYIFQKSSHLPKFLHMSGSKYVNAQFIESRAFRSLTASVFSGPFLVFLTSNDFFFTTVFSQLFSNQNSKVSIDLSDICCNFSV